MEEPNPQQRAHQLVKDFAIQSTLDNGDTLEETMAKRKHFIRCAIRVLKGELEVLNKLAIKPDAFSLLPEIENEIKHRETAKAILMNM